jgi:hypothetical protein
MSKLSGIDIIGIDSGNLSDISPQENIILRIDKKNPIADYFPYLIVADSIRSLDSKTDLFLIDPLQGKDALKRKAKRGLGIEISINPVKKLDAHLVARWLKELKSIYIFCQSNDCQFILSSGATSLNEMISARSFESILTVVGIDPKAYWMKISGWLYAKTKARWQNVKS